MNEMNKRIEGRENSKLSDILLVDKQPFLYLVHTPHLIFDTPLHIRYTPFLIEYIHPCHSLYVYKTSHVDIGFRLFFKINLHII